MSQTITDKKIAEGVYYSEDRPITFHFYASGSVFVIVSYGQSVVNTLWTGRAVDLDTLVVFDDTLFDNLFMEWDD